MLAGKTFFVCPVVYSTDRSQAMVPVLVLLFVVYSTRRFVLSLALCHFDYVFFSPISISITSLRKERAYLSAFRTFVRFALVWFCLFPLTLGVLEGLRLSIVAFPGLFSYLSICACLVLSVSSKSWCLCCLLLSCNDNILSETI